MRPSAAAVVYYRLGLTAEVRASLMTLRRGDLAHAVDRRWAAMLRERMGDFSRSHRLAPVPRDGGLPDYPADGWRVDARLAYPKGFADAVEGEARAAGIPEGLLYALIRAESGFWAQARSPANARGLTQVITPTAWAMARKLKIKRFRRWRLYEPEMSVRVAWPRTSAEPSPCGPSWLPTVSLMTSPSVMALTYTRSGMAARFFARP